MQVLQEVMVIHYHIEGNHHFFGNDKSHYKGLARNGEFAFA